MSGSRSKQWPADHQVWHEEFWRIQHAPIFQGAAEQEFRQKAVLKYSQDLEQEVLNKFNTNRFRTKETWTDKKLLEFGVVPIRKITRTICNDWKVGDRVAATKVLPYSVPLPSGSMGTVQKEQLNTKECIGVVWDGVETLMAVRRVDVKRPPIYGSMCLATALKTCRWPLLKERPRADDVIEPALRETEANMRLLLRKGYVTNSIALENTHKENFYIVASGTKLKYEDYTGRKLDEHCSFFMKPVGKFAFRLESCSMRRFIGVTDPEDRTLPVIKLFPDDSLKPLVTFMYVAATNPQSEKIHVEASSLGGHNIAVKWEPNLGQVRIWVQQGDHWHHVADQGGFRKPCAWVFSFGEIKLDKFLENFAWTPDPIRVCIAPMTRRHFFNRLRYGEWIRFGGSVSEWVELPFDIDLAGVNDEISRARQKRLTQFRANATLGFGSSDSDRELPEVNTARRSSSVITDDNRTMPSPSSPLLTRTPSRQTIETINSKKQESPRISKELGATLGIPNSQEAEPEISNNQDATLGVSSKLEATTSLTQQQISNKHEATAILPTLIPRVETALIPNNEAEIRESANNQESTNKQEEIPESLNKQDATAEGARLHKSEQQKAKESAHQEEALTWFLGLLEDEED